jgi:glycosyltransferase involved in cell wall biosynthesis
LGIALKREGHEVHIIIGGQGSVIDLFKDCGLQVINVQSLKRNISPFDDIKAYIEIKNTLNFLKPDIVSAHSSKAGFIGRLAASKLGIPVLFTAHGWSFTAGKSKPARKLYRYLENFIVPKTNYFITVSDYDKSLAQKVLKIPSKKIQTVHNGMVDVPNKYRAEPGKAGIVSIVMVARFDQQKNHVELLKAVKELKNFHIYFVGDGPLLASVKQKTKELGLSSCVTFTGYSSSVEKWMAKAQIFTLISNWEGFPRSTIEAMRAGLPVIISDVGGAAEALEHGKSGFVVKKGDVSSLKIYLKKLIDDSSLRKKMGENARNHFEKHLTFEHMYSKTVVVYKKIILNYPND